MQTIEREFHLHEGQEREIIMKLWLKNQSMISILHRYRYLLQDLKLDDQDFLGGLKVGFSPRGRDFSHRHLDLSSRKFGK